MIRELLVSPKIGLQVAATFVLALGINRYWPDAGSGWHRFITPFILLGAAIWIGILALGQIVKYHVQVRRQRLAKDAKRVSSDGGFETEENLEADGRFDPNGGVPVGTLNGRPIFAQPTHWLVNAPAGTQKTVAAVIPALVHGYRVSGKRKGQSKAASVIVLDLKRELKAMTARLREKVHGQFVFVLDPADPASDSYNPLDLVIDCLHRDLPRTRALTFANLIAHMLEPEPVSDSKNKFWREGARNLVILVMLWLCLFEPERANLAQVCRIIRDPLALEQLLKECATSDALNGELGVMARDVLEQGKYFDEFRTGAALALKSFSAAGELANVTACSSFRWRDCKTKLMAVYVCANLAESRIFSVWLRLMAECATMELEFSPGNIPVHLCLDELTNINGFDITPKLTALRASGVRAHLIFQERSELVRVFGEQAMETIYGEVDCEQYFGIQDAKLAKDLEARLGTVAVMKPSYQTGENPWDAYRETAGAQRKPLMSAYELMHCLKPTDQILFIKSRKKPLRPILCQKITYDKVKEWISMLDDNPIEGGKLRGPPTIQMAYSKTGVRVTRFKRTSKRLTWENIKRFGVLVPPLWAIWAGVWLSLAHMGWGRVVSFISA